MLRPSDIAPNAQTVDASGVKKVVFTADQVTFTDQGAKIHFFGIKNDTKRTGFETVLPCASNVKLDPVQTLHDYIERTDCCRPSDNALFLTLRPPFKALEASSIAKILEKIHNLTWAWWSRVFCQIFSPYRCYFCH